MSKKTTSYQKSAQKATGKSEVREQRRHRAFRLVPIDRLAAEHLSLGKDCPYCKQQDVLLFNVTDNTFHCKACKEQGSAGRLVQRALSLTPWKAVAYLESIVQPPREDKETFHWQEPAERENFRVRVERVKKTHRIESVIASQAGVTLKRVGSNLFCHCPFPDHEDNTPSFSIHPQKQLYHCFGCKRGGDVLQFISDYCDKSLLEALDLLDPSGAVVENADTFPAIDDSTPGKRQKLVEQCSRFFRQRLASSRVAQEFLFSRSLGSSELVEHFKLGFDDGQINQAAGVEVKKQLGEIGFLNQKQNVRFYQCVTFALEDGEGNVVSLYGRRINNHKGAKHQFPQGRIAGIVNALAFKASREIILTEGAMDAASVWVMGEHNVSCVFSASHIPQLILDQLVRYSTEKVYLALDNDEAGDEACRRIAERLASLSLTVVRVRFPEGIKDANELLVRMGQESASECLKRLLREAQPLTASESPQQLPVSDLPQVTVGKEQVEFCFAERNYRVRGFARNMSFDTLRVTLRAKNGESFHVDTLDLFNARQRSLFIKTTAKELAAKEPLVRHEIGRILLRLEELQEQQIAAAVKPDTKEVVLSAQERREALDFLRSKNLITRIKDDFVCCGLVGEEDNAVLGYLAALTRKQEDPLMLVIQSSSAAGKSTLMETILAFVPEEDRVRYSAMTGQSLFYMGEQSLVHKILAISEEEGAERASYAIKLMQSEKRLSIASTGKDPKSGRLMTHEYHVEGPAQIMMTTTAAEMDDELQNRCLVLAVNEGHEQTQAIHRRQREHETLAGLVWRKRRAARIKLHQNAQRLLRPLAVVNPYADQLTFPKTRLRARRDHMKYLCLIRAIALLHQHQREVRKVSVEGEVIEYVEAVREDIAIANQLLAAVMGTTLDDMAPQTRKLLLLLAQMVKDNCQKQGIDQESYRFSRRDVRGHSGWGDTQLKVHLARLVDLEYLAIHKCGHSQRHLYQLTYRGEGKEGEAFLPGLISTEKLVGENKTGRGKPQTGRG